METLNETTKMYFCAGKYNVVYSCDDVDMTEYSVKFKFMAVEVPSSTPTNVRQGRPGEVWMTERGAKVQIVSVIFKIENFMA